MSGQGLVSEVLTARGPSGWSKEKKFLALGAIAVVSIIVLGVPLSSITFEPELNYQIIDFDYEHAYQDLEALVSIGPRMAGTQGERFGAEYILAGFKDAGLDAHIEEFTEMLWEADDASISLVPYRPVLDVPDPTASLINFEHTVDFVLQVYSGSRGWSNIRDDLEIFDAGRGMNDSDYQGVEGKAAIIRLDGSDQSNSILFFKAWELGAAAIILNNNIHAEQIGYVPIVKGSPQPESYPSADYPDIPLIMVSKEMGEVILSQEATARLRLNIQTTIEERQIQVVIGDVRGSMYPEEVIMLGAHHDTHYVSAGAVDNTVGVVSIMQLAREFSTLNPKRTVRFATWGGEEEGLFGSIGYYLEHKADLDRNLQYYSNFDMSHVDLDRGNVLPISSNDNQTIEHLWRITDQLFEQEPELDWTFDVSIGWSQLHQSSDQAYYAQNGFPVISCWGSGSYEYHTYLDTIDRVHPISLQLGARIIGSYSLYLANL